MLETGAKLASLDSVDTSRYRINLYITVIASAPLLETGNVNVIAANV